MIDRAKQVLQAIESFLKTSGMSATRFGYLTLGDPGLVFALRNGRDPRLPTIEKMYAFMSTAGGKTR